MTRGAPTSTATTAPTPATAPARSTCNEFNIFENRFIDEFRLAQRNLRANIAATGTATFAYTGQPGTAPLPTFLAFFNAQNAANAGNAALYTGTNWTSATFLNFLAERNPQSVRVCVGRHQPSGLMGNATLPRQRRGRGHSRQLLRRQSRPARRRVPAHQHRRVEIQLDADRAAPPLCRRPAVPDQLRLRQGLRHRLGDLARGSTVDPRRRHARRRDARDQGQHRLRPAVRQRPQVDEPGQRLRRSHRRRLAGRHQHAPADADA